MKLLKGTAECEKPEQWHISFLCFFHFVLKKGVIVKLAANHWFDCFISVKPFQELLWLLCPPPAAPCEKQYMNANMEVFIHIY